MTKFDNRTVIEKFISGDLDYRSGVESHSGNLYVSGDKKRLMNYATCLMERNADLNMIIVNRTSYSNSTSKIQSWILGALWQRFSIDWINENVIQVNNVHMGTNYLYQAAKNQLEWNKGLHEYVIENHFDVWGNKKDGWEINESRYEEITVTLHDTASDKDVLQALKDSVFLNKYARITSVIIIGDEFGWEIMQKKDSKPLCRVELKSNLVNA